MSFLDCIQTAVDTGRLGAAKGAEAQQAYADALDQGIKEGLSPDVAESQAAMRSLEATTTLTYNKRKERINELQKHHRIYERVRSAPDPANSLGGHSFLASNSSLMDEVVMTHAAVKGQLLALMGEVQRTFEPKWAGLKAHPVDNMDNVVRAVYGEQVNPAAEGMAKQTQAVVEQIRVLQNLEGANIAPNPNFKLWQSHDRFLVREAGEDQWVADHLADGVLDWDIIQYAGKQVPEDQREAVLRQTWLSITSEGRNKGMAGRTDQSSLASRLSRERFLYYASADGWIGMNQKYGTGDFYTQLVDHVDSAARNTALMRTFGPNPEAGKEFAKRTLKEVTLEQQKKGGRAATKAENREAKEFLALDAQFDIFARNVDTGQGDALVQTIASARQLTGTALLGTVVASTISDPFYAMWSRSINNMPWLHVLPQYISSIANSKGFKQEMIDMGIGCETCISMAIDSNPYNAASEGAKVARHISEVNYRIQGAAWMTQIGRGNAGFDFAKNLARNNAKSIDDLPFGRELRNLGITQEDWDLVRNMPFYQPQYYNFGTAKLLRPIDMYQHAGTDAERAAANKFMMAQESFVRASVPSPNIRARQFIGQNVSQRTWAGFILANTAQLTLFPVSIMFNQWKMVLRQPGFGKLSAAMKLAAFTTAGGAVVATVKDALMGKEPPDYLDPKFVARAMALGGGGAIFGDFLYNNVSAVNDYYSAGTPTDTQTTKFVRGISETYKEVMMDGADAEPLKKWGDFTWGLLPKPAPFKLIMERELQDRWLEWADPAAYNQKVGRQQAMEAETGQGMWWGSEPS